MTDDWTEYRLTEDEYRSITDALNHAQDSAVHTDSRVKFQRAFETLMRQRDHHATDKTLVSERFEGDGDE